MAILPDLELPLNKIQIEIGLFNSTNLGAVSIGVLDNNWDPSTFKEIKYCQTRFKLGSSTGSAPYVLEIFSQMLNLYQGNGKTLAIRNSTEYPIYVKYVSLTELPDCIQPQQVELTYPTETEITVNWVAGLEDAWEIKLNDSIIENVTTNPYRITGLDQGTNYTVSVRAVCDATHTSEWSESAVFVTKCGVNSLPMNEDFSNLPRTLGTADVKRAALTCWDNMVSEVSIDKVFKGEGTPFIPASNVYPGNLWVSQWLTKLGDYKQLESYRYDSKKYKYKWFISPQYSIEGNATLSFDIRSCGNAGQAVSASVDRTFVAISTDNGVTWQKANATEITDIDSVYTTKSISLGKYSGQTIRIAFYDENTVSYKMTEQPYILIDNVRMNCSETYPMADNACQGYDYEGNGFVIAKEDLPLAGQDSTYYRFAANMQNGCDSVVALTITTRTPATATVYEAICAGETYDFGPYHLSEPNPVGTPYYITGETQYGCDSTIYLYLTVNPSDTSVIAPIEVDVNQLPYQVDELFTVPAGTATGELIEIVKVDACHFNRYAVTVKDLATGLIYINSDVDHVDVYDILGRKIQTIVPQVGELQLHLPTGVYMLRTTMTNGQIETNKISIK